jgi:hypothetical protein
MASLALPRRHHRHHERHEYFHHFHCLPLRLQQLSHSHRHPRSHRASGSPGRHPSCYLSCLTGTVICQLHELCDCAALSEVHHCCRSHRLFAGCCQCPKRRIFQAHFFLFGFNQQQQQLSESNIKHIRMDQHSGLLLHNLSLRQ